MRRPPATLADYVLVGINPALIMFLIGSLTFFLLQVFYSGDFGWRLSFIFAMFIMGAVSVCRISLEEGANYAVMFGAPLGIVSLIAMSRFGEFSGNLAAFSVIINAGIVALIWWLAYMLTWDCTVIDERADTSDQGLLQAAGIHAETQADESVDTDALDLQQINALVDERSTTPNWLKWTQPSKKPHAHGVWVIYFSLLALPLFGLGQRFIVQNARTYAFSLLVVYVATALALLMSTSFLGLRRYLRQRHLEMPLDMTAAWLGVGSILIVVVLALCLLIPRPGAELAVSQLPPITFGAKNLAPSHTSVGSDGQKSDPTARAASQPEKGSSDQPSSNPSSSSGGDQSQSTNPNSQSANGNAKTSQAEQKGSNSSESQSSGGQSGQAKSQDSNAETSDQQSGKGASSQSEAQKGSDSGQAKSNGQTNPQSANQKASSQPSGNPAQKSSQQPPNEAQQAQPSSQPSSQAPARSFSPASLVSSLGSFIKFVLYAIVLGILLVLAWWYRRELMTAWQQLLKELRELWERLFGQSAAAEGTTQNAISPKPKRPFAGYADPFATGQASRMDRMQLLQYTFDAMQAWGREHACHREESETPHEFVQRIGMSAPHFAREAAVLAEFYGLAAYANGALPANINEPLRVLWNKMQTVPGVAAVR